MMVFIKKNSNNKVRLAIIFATVVFVIMLITLVLLFIGLYILHQFGIHVVNDKLILPLLGFAIASLSIGTCLAFLLSSYPLEPIHILADATDKIAAGDFSTRVKLKGPEEIVQLGEKFNHMAQELGSVELFRSDFINNFSHEFKTPIVSIRGFAKMLKLDGLTPDEEQEYLDIIINESERLSELSTNVLNLSKIEQQTILTDLVLFNVSEQIRRVIAMLDSKGQKKGIDFCFDSDEYYILGNEELLKQVWINLLDNAIKFSPKNDKIIVSIYQAESEIVFSFSNTSDPIDPEVATHIFEKFYQADKSHATHGNGLGLTIAKRIVTLHGGTIAVVPTNKREVCFEVRLPIVH